MPVPCNWKTLSFLFSFNFFNLSFFARCIQCSKCECVHCLLLSLFTLKYLYISIYKYSLMYTAVCDLGLVSMPPLFRSKWVWYFQPVSVGDEEYFMIVYRHTVVNGWPFILLFQFYFESMNIFLMCERTYFSCH